jgi:hypothetical protein
VIAQTPAEVQAWLFDQAPVVVILCIVLFAFIRGWIHTDREFQALRTDLLFYRDMALRSTVTAGQAVVVAEKIAEGSPEVRA